MNFFATAVVFDTGLIVFDDSDNNDNKEGMVSMAMTLFDPENIFQFELLQDIDLTYESYRIFITKLNDPEDLTLYVLMLSSEIQDYKQKIMKAKKKIEESFFN